MEVGRIYSCSSCCVCGSTSLPSSSSRTVLVLASSSCFSSSSSSSPQCIGGGHAATPALNARSDSSARACSLSLSRALSPALLSFSSSRFIGNQGKQLDVEAAGRRGEIIRKGSGRGPVAPRSRGGVRPRLPGSPAPDGWPPSNISPPGLGQFRPPPTAYVPHYEESEEERRTADSRKKIVLEQLRNGLVSWQEKAAFVKELQELGVTSEDMYNQTYVPIQKQLEMVVAAQVYESVVQSGASEEILQQFDEFSLTLLYSLRTVSAAQRRAAAEYVVENSLSVEDTQKLAWAMKDHERRGKGRMGFTPAPGDCLAFMYHRQAQETQDMEQKQLIVEQGLQVAVSETAKQRFAEFN